MRLAHVALLLAASRSPHRKLTRSTHPTLCAPLTVTRYGNGTSLHVDLKGTRSVRRPGALPQKPARSVRIVFVSDTHNQLSQMEIPDGDILVHTGDITFCSEVRTGSGLQVYPGQPCHHADLCCDSPDAGRSLVAQGVQRRSCGAATSSQGDSAP